jgi:HAD superfamily hydrolase (TIGR01490 family)
MNAEHKMIAVFDVDETLIRGKSMFDFLHHALRVRRGEHDGKSEFSSIRNRLEAARGSLDRALVNRMFYKELKGWPLVDLQRLAEDWFDNRQRGNFFITELREAFEQHKANGDCTVLLSGSANFILAPIARDLGADHILATSVEVDADGVLTGEIVGQQTIGMGKAVALQALLDSLGQHGRVTGYGDHESDSGFLQLCGDACVVLPRGASASWALPHWKTLEYKQFQTPTWGMS